MLYPSLDCMTSKSLVCPPVLCFCLVVWKCACLSDAVFYFSLQSCNLHSAVFIFFMHVMRTRQHMAFGWLKIETTLLWWHQISVSSLMHIFTLQLILIPAFTNSAFISLYFAIRCILFTVLYNMFACLSLLHCNILFVCIIMLTDDWKPWPRWSLGKAPMHKTDKARFTVNVELEIFQRGI